MNQRGSDPGTDEAAARDAATDSASDPYAGLDEVTRAKRRLLDCAREEEGGPGRRVGLRTAAGAFAAGFVLTRFPFLRRTLLGTALRFAKFAIRLARPAGRDGA